MTISRGQTRSQTALRASDSYSSVVAESRDADGKPISIYRFFWNKLFGLPRGPRRVLTAEEAQAAEGEKSTSYDE
jgi:hypothetical protein